MTGGRVFPVRDAAELFRAAIQISQELRNQYILGYYPTNRVRDGNWRKLKIQLSGSASEDKLRLYARRGYYAPAD